MMAQKRLRGASGHGLVHGSLPRPTCLVAFRMPLALQARVIGSSSSSPILRFYLLVYKGCKGLHLGSACEVVAIDTLGKQ